MSQSGLTPADFAGKIVLVALLRVWDMVAPGGILLVDRYRLSPHNQILFKYLLRPATKRMDSETLLSLTERAVSRIFPAQTRMLARLQGGSLRRLARLVLIRLTPNSVFAPEPAPAGAARPRRRAGLVDPRHVRHVRAALRRAPDVPRLAS